MMTPGDLDLKTMLDEDPLFHWAFINALLGDSYELMEMVRWGVFG